MSIQFADQLVDTAGPLGQAHHARLDHRSIPMNDLRHSLVQEMQRERLRQAERRRAERVALRARRALAQQLMR